MTRTDETWFRLREWTQGQTPSERLAAHVLDAEGYENIDPSHPLGGKDGGKDAVATKDGKSWIMGVYFPRGQQTFTTIKKKFTEDLAGAKTHSPHGFVFVTNQELTLGERADLEDLGDGTAVELYHLERTTGVIDRPKMAQIRKQYLDIEAGPPPIDVSLSIDGAARYFSNGDAARAHFTSAVGDIERKQFAEADEAARKASPFGVPPHLSSLLGIESDSQPRTRADLDNRLNQWSEEVREGWADSEQYLAAITWPGMRLRLRNIEKVFLNDVQVIITIKGAQGLDWVDRDAFEFSEFIPPVSPPGEPLFDSFLRPPVMGYSKGLQLAGAPLEWENVDDETVVITIDLQHLRPDQTWTSDDELLILHAIDHTASSLTAEWTVTAQTYGESYSGAPINIPVQAGTIGDSYQAAVAQSDQT
ncbi:MAG: hypothetical protein WBG53_04645 [Rhodococcus sp. (in: high G+C Gram-positive bacteria)]